MRSWTGVVRLRLRNGSALAWKFTAVSGSGRQEGVLSAGATAEMTLPLPTDRAAPVTFSWVALATGADGSRAPSVELVP